MSELWPSLVVSALALLVVAPWLVYPLVMLLVPRRSSSGPVPSSGSPPVTVLIPAHNEAEHIEEKIRNTFALEYPPDRLTVLVLDDGSSDATGDLARAYSDHRLIVLGHSPRRGKAATLNELVEAAPTELLLMTDASAELEADALRRLVRVLDDRSYGVAAARYVVAPRGAPGAVTESSYWGFEAWVRRMEAARDLLIGASGAAYLVRKRLVPWLPDDTVNDDWVIPLFARRAGQRVAYVPGAIASDEPTRDLETMYARWVRIAYGNMQMLGRYHGAFFGGRLALPLIRKLLRTLSPLFLALLATALSAAAIGDPMWGGGVWPTLGAGVLLGGAALLPDRGFGASRPVRFIRLAALSQVAYLVGLYRWIGSEHRDIWRRPGATAAPDFQRPPPIPRSVRFVKRTLDLMSATIALVGLMPFMAILGLLIKATSPGPVFYVQRRVCPDVHGQPTTFPLYKVTVHVGDVPPVTFAGLRGDPLRWEVRWQVGDDGFVGAVIPCCVGDRQALRVGI